MEGVDANASITRPTSSVSMNSIRDSSEKSNPQNGPRASAEVTSRRSLEKELQERQDAYQKASDRNDTEYDYRGELAKIRELEQRLEGMKEEKIPHQSADSVRDDSEEETDSHASTAALARNDGDDLIYIPESINAPLAETSGKGGSLYDLYSKVMPQMETMSPSWMPMASIRSNTPFSRSIRSKNIRLS